MFFNFSKLSVLNVVLVVNVISTSIHSDILFINSIALSVLGGAKLSVSPEI